jgi:hypothetical protein
MYLIIEDRLNKMNVYKHSSLLYANMNDEKKYFIVLLKNGSILKSFLALTLQHNKLGYFLLVYQSQPNLILATD